MTRAAILPILLILGTFFLSAGCISSSQDNATLTPTETATANMTGTTPTTATFTKPPTTYPENIPAIYEVDVQVERNVIAIDPFILATFRGGKGTNVVQKVEMTVVRSDGKVEKGTMPHPKVGDSIRLNGTTKSDFVTVDVFLATGPTWSIYRVLNESMTFRAAH